MPCLTEIKISTNASAVAARFTGPPYRASIPISALSCSTASRAPSSPTQRLPGRLAVLAAWSRMAAQLRLNTLATGPPVVALTY
jgi:hypothetical protein